MKSMKKFLVLLLAAIISVMSLTACGEKADTADQDEATNAASSEIVVDQENKSVSIECTVADLGNHAHWFVVNEDGSMADKTLLKTAVDTDSFYDALVEVAGEKVWNDSDVQFSEEQSINDNLEIGVGNSDFAVFDVEVLWGGNTYALSDIVTDAQYKGEKYDGSYQVAFSGNLDNQHNAKTGCITCFGGCYMGITSGFDTPMMIEYTPKNLPGVGENVTVKYILK